MAWQASFLNKKTFRERLAFTTWQDTLSMKMKFLIFHFKETPFKRFVINVHEKRNFCEKIRFCCTQSKQSSQDKLSRETVLSF